jgi:hypothetical protein
MFKSNEKSSEKYQVVSQAIIPNHVFEGFDLNETSEDFGSSIQKIRKMMGLAYSIGELNGSIGVFISKQLENLEAIHNGRSRQVTSIRRN